MVLALEHFSMNASANLHVVSCQNVVDPTTRPPASLGVQGSSESIPRGPKRLQSHPKLSQTDFKVTPIDTRVALNDPDVIPRSSQSDPKVIPRWPQSHAKWAQNHSKLLQSDPKMMAKWFPNDHITIPKLSQNDMHAWHACRTCMHDMHTCHASM